MRIDHAWIAAHIPHQGRMCLLDEVLEWSADSICCQSESHRREDNALRAHGRLGIACGVEYAAQAMAVHGALRAASSSQDYRGGLLASVRGLTMHVDRLDDIAGALLARATLVSGDSTMVLYEFSLGDSNRVLLTGRATIAFAAASGEQPAMRASP
jgi:predicted hotdog family 3-hydroxylacyl-ACP dehydratase